MQVAMWATVWSGSSAWNHVANIGLLASMYLGGQLPVQTFFLMSPTNPIYDKLLLPFHKRNLPKRNFQKMGRALTLTLDFIERPWAVPNLRRLTIEYVDCGFEDLYDNRWFSSWPLQITELEIKFTFSKRTTARTIEHMRKKYRNLENRSDVWGLHSLRHLSLAGACKEFIADMLGNCPELETLEIDGLVRLALSLPWFIQSCCNLSPKWTLIRDTLKGLFVLSWGEGYLLRNNQKISWSGVQLDNQLGRGWRRLPRKVTFSSSID